jgi:MFS family permease
MTTVASNRPGTAGRVQRIAYAVLAGLLGLAAGFGIGGFLALAFGFTGGEHAIHDVGWGVMTGVLLSVGLLAQVHRPERKVAALQQAGAVAVAFLIGMLALGSFDVFGFIPLVAVLLLVALHPNRSEVFRIGDMSRRLAGLTVLGAIPFTVFALGQLELQQLNIPGDEHAEDTHYVGMFVMALALVLVGLVASGRAAGWRISAWSAGVGTAVYGLASVIFPQLVSSAGTGWGIAAILGGLAFIALAESEVRRVPRREEVSV